MLLHYVCHVLICILNVIHRSIGHTIMPSKMKQTQTGGTYTCLLLCVALPLEQQ